MSRKFRIFWQKKNREIERRFAMRSLNLNKLSRFISRMLRALFNVQNVNINISQPSENVNFFSIFFSIFKL